MQSQAKLKKIVYSDSGIDRAITGQILEEDDFFITIDSHGRKYRLGKKAIICIKDIEVSQ